MNFRAHLFALFPAAALVAAPVVDDVAWTQADGSPVVTIAYTLSGEAAIVTPQCLTNGVPIADALLAEASGDAFVRVEPGDRRIYWRVPESIPAGSLTNCAFKLTVWSLETPPPYMVVDLVADSMKPVVYAASEDALPYGGIASAVYRTSKLAMRLVPAKGNTWTMGTPPNGASDNAREVPRIVTMTNDFYLGVFPVTVAQHRFVTGSVPTLVTNPDDHPVNYITFEALRGPTNTCNWPVHGHAVSSSSYLGRFRARTGIDFDLPTSAQWEYACRAGAGTKYYWGSSFSSAFADQSGGGTAVGTHLPNAFGLHDMASLPWDWCLDWVNGLGNAGDAVTEPIGPDWPTGDGGQARRVGRATYSAKVNPQVYTYEGKTYGYRLLAPVSLKW